MGGQEVVTATLAKSFVEHGHNVVIASFKLPNSMMVERTDKRIKLYSIGPFKYSSYNVKILRKILVDEKIEIIINQWGLPYIPIQVINDAGKGLGVKVISVYHNNPSTNARIQSCDTQLSLTESYLKKFFISMKRYALKKITSHSMRYVYNHSDRYMVLSPSFIKPFSNFTGITDLKRLVVQTNPVTIDVQESLPEFYHKNKEIIYVGRLDNNQKRIDRILSTWSILMDKFPDWSLLIVGDGEDREMLECKSSELRLQRVSFEGFRQPVDYYKRASILMLTSDFEGFPLVLAEAMSFGVIPCVYGSYSAVYDIINNNRNGIVLQYDKNGYNAKEMAIRMSKIMSNSILFNNMAQEAIKTSRNYSIEKIYNQWIDIFKTL